MISKEVPKIGNLRFNLKKLVKEDKIKPGTSIKEKIINIIAEINEIKRKNTTTDKVSEAKS